MSLGGGGGGGLFGASTTGGQPGMFGSQSTGLFGGGGGGGGQSLFGGSTGGSGLGLGGGGAGAGGLFGSAGQSGFGGGGLGSTTTPSLFGGGTSLGAGGSSLFGNTGAGGGGGGLFGPTTPGSTFGSSFGGGGAGVGGGLMMSPNAQQQQQPQTPLPPPQPYHSGAMLESVDLVQKAWAKENEEEKPEEARTPFLQNNISTPARGSEDLLKSITLKPRRQSFGTLLKTPTTKDEALAPQTPGGSWDISRSLKESETLRGTPSLKAIKLKRVQKSMEKNERLQEPKEEKVRTQSKENEEKAQEPSDEKILECCPRLAEGSEGKGYSTEPSITELQKMSEDELSQLPTFAVERQCDGRLVARVEWAGPVDVRGLVIGKDIVIDDDVLEVYPSNETYESKPLNKPARCTMYVPDLPNDVKEQGAEKEYLKAILEDPEQETATEFVSWNPEEKLVVFDVMSF